MVEALRGLQECVSVQLSEIQVRIDKHVMEQTSQPTRSSSPLQGKRVTFVGKLGGMTRREAMQLVRDHGGVPVERDNEQVDCVIVGAEQLPLDAEQLAREEAMRELATAGELEIIAESDLWQRLGLVETTKQVKQLYTPAMLADLLKVPIATIRRWHRLKLIEPKQLVHRLPYFDFEEIQSARQIAAWIDHGAKPQDLQRQLRSLSRWLPARRRSLAQLDIILEGRQLLLRSGDGLIEAGGQLRIDFDALESPSDNEFDREPSILSLAEAREAEVESAESELSLQDILDRSLESESDGRLREAIEWIRVGLAKFGPTAELHFQLAELLYRDGDLAGARERYYAAIEVDDAFVEARANLGCVLHETGRIDLAIAAFRGALELHEAYADVHYHLARVLDEVEHRAEATKHWERFRELAPHSPWSYEAEMRINESPGIYQVDRL